MDSVQRTSRLTIVNPVAEPEAHQESANRFPPANRLSSLDGKTIALYWNGKHNGLPALERTREQLSRLFKNLKFIDVFGEMGGSNRYLSPEQLDMLEKRADAVVCTTAD
jgi:hypothetical protein